MGETTSISVRPETKERLEDYRRPTATGSWSDDLEAMMNVLPTVEAFQNGCSRCGQEPHADHPGESYGGVLMWFEDSHTATTHVSYFCSDECLTAAREANRKWVPEEPDLVVVGGHEALRTEFKGATFYLDGETMEVGVPVPGAFGGADDLGNEYNYLGEPVYVYHEGQYRHTGTIEQIVHEETHTGLLIDPHGDHATVMLNHPDEDRREEFRERYVQWYDMDCPGCGAELRVHAEMSDDVVCSECEATVPRDEPPPDPHGLSTDSSGNGTERSAEDAEAAFKAAKENNPESGEGDSDD